MSFLRRIFSGDRGLRTLSGATLGDLLDFLETERPKAEEHFFDKHRQCPDCESDYLRVGAWAKNGEAGWTVTCVNCGYLLEETLEVRAE